jgi:hypothetical protein
MSRSHFDTAALSNCKKITMKKRFSKDRASAVFTEATLEAPITTRPVSRHGFARRTAQAAAGPYCAQCSFKTIRAGPSFSSMRIIIPVLPSQRPLKSDILSSADICGAIDESDGPSSVKDKILSTTRWLPGLTESSMAASSAICGILSLKAAFAQVVCLVRPNAYTISQSMTVVIPE